MRKSRKMSKSRKMRKSRKMSKSRKMRKSRKMHKSKKIKKSKNNRKNKNKNRNKNKKIKKTYKYLGKNQKGGNILTEFVPQELINIKRSLSSGMANGVHMLDGKPSNTSYYAYPTLGHKI